MKPSNHEPQKRFHIQRRRLGEIKYMRPEGDFGFIDAEDFREDVFFHKSAWEGEIDGRRREPEVGIYVEFEIDEEYREQEKKLRAKVVRLTNRPMGKRLSGRDTPHLVNKHHPKARQKRPTWRGGDGPLSAAPPKDNPQGKDAL
ncbi:MAG: cold shock domain-containing protein [Planctomycetaceae bacterium]